MLVEDSECRLIVLERCLKLAFPTEHPGNTHQRSRCAESVADLPIDGVGFLARSTTRGPVAESFLEVSETHQPSPKEIRVSTLAGERECLQLKVQRLSKVAA